MDKASLERAFHEFDHDKNGSLSHDEFKKCAQKIKSGISDADIDKLFNNFDKDSNGKITLDEFLKGMAH